jgi:hypothetical protein
VGPGLRPGPAQNQAQGPGPAPPPAPPDPFRQAMDWVQANLGLVIGIVVAVVLVGVAIGLLLAWLKSRGTFLFLDGVARNRAAVAEPWREYAREGNSLFRFLVLFVLASFVGALAIVGGAVGLALPDIRARQFGASASTALAVGIPLLVLFILAAGILYLLLFDFVVPIMYQRRQGVMTSWTDFRHFILAGHASTLVVYVLFQVVMGLVLGVLTILFCCGSLCLALLPYLGTVITLPLSVFRRAYPLVFLEQFGSEWRIIPGSAKPSGLPFEDLDFS